MKVFAVQRETDNQLLQGSNLITTMEGAWTPDIREAALYALESRAYAQRDKAREQGVACRVVVLAPLPW